MRALGGGGILVAQSSPEGGLLSQDPEPMRPWPELEDVEAGTLAFTLPSFTIPILLLYREKHGGGKGGEHPLYSTAPQYNEERLLGVF